MNDIRCYGPIPGRLPLHNAIDCLPPLKRTMIWVCGLLLIGSGFYMPLPAAAAMAAPLDALVTEQSDLPWVIEADRITYHRKTDTYIASGNVAIQKGETILLADEVQFDQTTGTATASGQIAVRIGSDELAAEKVTIDLPSQTGTLYGARLFLRDNNFHITGEKIEKTGPDRYIVQNPSVTTCDGDNPAWQISGSHLDVTIEGYGYVKGATFKARGIPLLYSPWLAFPAKVERQSGLLAPEIGSSSRKGFFLIQPLYWAVSDSVDTTFYGHYLSQRGIKLGGEFRYAVDVNTSGTWMFDYLEDRQIDDGTGDSSEKWGYTDDDLLRTNRDRYWLRGSHRQDLPLGFSGQLDIDVVSDQDYLTEFKSGLTGFEDTRLIYNNAFYREMAEFDDPNRLNQLNLNRLWHRYNLNLSGRYYQNARLRNSDEANDTLQRLPLIDLNAAKQQIFNLPAYFDLETNYNYLFRQEGTRGHRLDFYPRFYVPMRMGRFATFEPSVGLRETAWFFQPDGVSAENTESNQRDHREIYDVNVELASQIFKVFGSENAKGMRVKHILKPEILYTYVPDIDQSDLPEFDALDRIDARNELAYSLTNFFILRRGHKSKGLAATANRSRFGYHQAGRFKLAQSYDINEAQNENLQPGQRRPFSPVRGELDVNLTHFMSLQSDAEWDVYENRFDSGNAAVTLLDNRRDRLSAEYRYTRNETESVTTDLLIQITNRWTASGEYEYNLLDRQRLKTAVGASYESGCWAAAAIYTDTPSEQRLEFRITLNGLGDLGYSL